MNNETEEIQLTSFLGALEQLDDDVRRSNDVRRSINFSKIILRVGLLISFIGITIVIVSSVYLAIIQHSTTPVDDELTVQLYESSGDDLEHYISYNNLEYDDHVETSGSGDFLMKTN